MIGWIRLHRKLTTKAYYSKDSEKVHLWIHLLMSANHTGREEMLGGRPIHCNSGQFTAGRKQLSQETGICESKIQRILTYFEKTEQQIEQLTTNTNRLITILNWHEYQDTEHQTEQQLNNNRTTTEQQLNNNRTHLNNVKNVKKEKNVKNYKKNLLSEIYISDYPNLNNDYIEIAKSFQELFKKNLEEAGAPTTTIDKAKGTWIDDIRLMIEVDKANIDNMRNIFKFLEKDVFWKQNILSTSKLREQYPKLIMKINNGTEKSTKKSGANRITDDYKRNITERLLSNEGN